MTTTSPLRLALIGAGAMGANHARVIAEMPRARLGVVIDADLGRAKGLADRFLARYSDDLADALKCDAAVVACATEAHLAVALPLLEQGLPLLVEKPLAPAVEQAEALLRASEVSGVPLQCGFVERYNPVVRMALSMAQGPLHLIGVRHSPAPQRRLAGVVEDLLIHDVDLAIRFAGGRLPSRVQVSGVAPQAGGYTELADCLLEFPGGPVANLSVSRLSQRKVRTLSVTTPDALLELDLLRQDITVFRFVKHELVEGGALAYRESTVIDVPYVRQAGEPLTLQLHHFIDLVEGRLDADEERASILPAHLVMAELHKQAAPVVPHGG